MYEVHIKCWQTAHTDLTYKRLKILKLTQMIDLEPY